MRCQQIACRLALILIASSPGCTIERDEAELPHAGGARMILETVLQQTDSVFLGNPIDVALGDNGDVFIADNMQQRVVRYSREGRLLMTYGRRGHGPGELYGVLGVGVAGDSLLLVADINKSAVAIYDIGTGEYLRDVGYRGIPGSLQERDGTVWMGLFNRESLTGVGAFTISAPETRYLVPSPLSYHADLVLGTFYSHVEALPLDSTLLVSFLGEPDLMVVDMSGHVLRSFRVPTVRRRGIPPELTRLWWEAKTSENQVQLSSMLLASHRFPNGDVALVYFDQKFRNHVPIRTGFITVVDSGLTRACVDIPLSLSQDGASHVMFLGDTLVTIEQEIAANDARAVMRRYALETAACSWQPLEPGTVHDATASGLAPPQ